jgi:tRNA G18 (ribose-2'-O)-methylase SpoU
MRGYFAVGAEQISKPMNLGNLLRSAHAFGASFASTIGAHHNAFERGSHTSRAVEHLPVYHWRSLEEMQLPRGARLVGVELTDDAVELPSFHHPLQAAYVLGPERGALSSQLLERCDYVVKIPTSFCINVAVAGAIVMYDRMRSHGRFAPRPLTEGAPESIHSRHVFGQSIVRTKSSAKS